MIVKKRILTLLTVFVVLLSFLPITIHANTLQSKSKGIVTHFIYERYLNSLPNRTIPIGDKDALNALINELNEALTCSVKYSTEEENVDMPCSAEWNVQDIPLTQPGSYNLIANLSAPKDCSFADGVRTQVIQPIYIIDPNMPVYITAVDEWNPSSMAVAVEQGGTSDFIEQDVNFSEYTKYGLSCVDMYNIQHYATVSWDFSTIDFETPGVYTIKGVPIAPQGTIFSPDLKISEATATISVQKSGKPDINCFNLFYPNIYFPWIRPHGELESISVWLSEDGGEWENITSNDGVIIDQTFLCIPISMFSNDRNYQIQVDYEGGQTGIFSLDWYDGIIKNYNYRQGDRDGGDTDGYSPPSNSETPSKKPPNNNNINDVTESEERNSYIERPFDTHSETVMAPSIEQSEENSSTISGLMLRTMIEDGNTAIFSKQGITVTLSKETIAALNIADSDIFTIKIMKDSKNRISFSVFINNKQVTALPKTIIMLPYTLKNKMNTIILLDDAGNTVSKGNYDTKQQFISFSVDTSGSFSISEQTSTNAMPNKHTKNPSNIGFPLAIVLIVLLSITRGCIFLMNRRKR